MSSFLEECLAGTALTDDIDDFIEVWHDSDIQMPLHQFLGMTRSEYSLWVADPDVLPIVINAHRQGCDVVDLLEHFNA